MELKTSLKGTSVVLFFDTVRSSYGRRAGRKPMVVQTQEGKRDELTTAMTRLSLCKIFRVLVLPL